MTNNSKEQSEDLATNKHFLITLLEPYILGARVQLDRVMSAHAKLQKKDAFTVTQLYAFIYETSGLLEHLATMQHLLHNAGFEDSDFGKLILAARNDMRHDARFDKPKEKQSAARNERLKKNKNMLFQFQPSENGIQCENANLSFSDIDNYINQADMLRCGLLSGCTIKCS